MTWEGSIAVVGGRVLGKLVDNLGWELDVWGAPQGANRLALAAKLCRRGREAEDPATRRRHDALAAPGAGMTGELTRKQLGLSAYFRWSGSLSGAVPLRLYMGTGRWISGPIALRGEVVV